MDKIYLITGSAGFIGFHLSKLLLEKGQKVIGVDCITDYYDVKLKKARLEILNNYSNFVELKTNIANEKELNTIFKEYEIDYVIHLAAQAGVRYSIEDPKSYLNSNIIGTFNILECIRKNKILHTLIASTSSVYGSNILMPFDEKQKTNTQVSFYAASKKACEVMSHSYSHIYDLPITNFRFFTVYGPWGRPDMALFKFVKNMKENKPIDIYNHGKMKRDFTYIDDIVNAIFLLTDCIPEKNNPVATFDSLSDVAPWRVVNIGNSKVQDLMEFVKEIEKNLGYSSKKNFLPMQIGDVKETFANCELLYKLTGFIPNTNISHGIKQFCSWYENYYE